MPFIHAHSFKYVSPELHACTKKPGYLYNCLFQQKKNNLHVILYYIEK